MSCIRLRNIETLYCLKNISLDIESGEFVVLLGASGAGKSTLLNVIAGLAEYHGEVYFDEQNMNQVPTEKRDVGYLLQDIYLFPHLSVFNNIAFSLRAKAYPADRIPHKVAEILELLSISHLRDRYPKELSGGEKQRAGLARSLIMEPKILLLDEPLSSLDPSTAKGIRKELKMLHSRLKLTTLYVTHNYVEAQELADRIVVIKSGELNRLGSVDDIFPQPLMQVK